MLPKLHVRSSIFARNVTDTRASRAFRFKRYSLLALESSDEMSPMIKKLTKIALYYALMISIGMSTGAGKLGVYAVGVYGAYDVLSS